MIYNFKKINYLFLIFIFVFGNLIAFNRGSNFSDADAYSVIMAYINYFIEGFYTPSRGGYGHPIPELLIGFLSYNFGTPISNIFCFSLFFSSLFFFYKAFFQSGKNVVLFIFLVLSNYYLFIENTNSIDYPIALFFFSIAIFFLKKKFFILSYILFGLTIASRANFLTFVYPILLIFFFDEIKEKKLKNLFNSFCLVTLVGIIFYIPLFDLHNYSLKFLDLPFLSNNDQREGWYGGPKLTLDSLFPRFVYKIYLITGIYSSIFIFLFLFLKKQKIDFLEKDNLILTCIILINLFVFFFMPTKILIINPYIIFTYIFLFKYLDKKKIIFLILLNFFQWFISYDVVKITYKEKKICFGKEATNYNFKFSIQRGKIFEYFTDDTNMTKCYSQFMGKYDENFEKGRPLKLSNNTTR